MTMHAPLSTVPAVLGTRPPFRAFFRQSWSFSHWIDCTVLPSTASSAIGKNPGPVGWGSFFAWGSQLSSGCVLYSACVAETYTPQNVGRRLRGLENEGVIEVKHEKNHAHYPFKGTTEQLIRRGIEWFDALPVQAA
jgi:hypothetical protein